MPTKPKRYMTRARAYIQKMLPKGAKVHGIYPRAFCAAVPAPCCAVFVTPLEDDTRPMPMTQQGETIHYSLGSFRADILDTKPPAIGQFRTLVYIRSEHSGLWYSIEPIPFEL